MKRLRVALIALGLSGFALFLILSWLNFYYLPKKAKTLVVEELEEQTGLNVVLPRLSFHLFKGMTLEALKLRDPKEGKIRFQADRVYVQHVWIPLVFKRKFVASSVTLVKPSFSLKRYADKRWNLQDYWKKEEKTTALFFSHRISIIRGDFLFTDQTLPEPFSHHLTNLNAKVNVGLPAHLSFKGDFGLHDSPTSISLQGRRSLRKEEWSFRATVKQFSLSEFLPYTKRYLPFLKTARGDLSFEADVDEKGAVDLQKILFAGKTKLLFKRMEGEAHLRLTGHLSYRAEEKEGLDYEFSAALREGTFQIPFLEQPLEAASGKLAFKKDELFFDDVKVTVGKTPFSLKGRLIHFQKPELDLTLSSQTDMRAFLENLPQGKALHPISMEGPIELTGHIKGKINAPTLSGTLDAKDLLVKDIPFFEEIQHLRGPITFTEKSLETDALTGQYRDSPLALKGTLTHFQNPRLDIRLHFMQPLQELQKAPLFQAIPEKMKPSLEGACQWDLSVKGPLHHLSEEDMSGSCRLQNASLTMPFLPSAVEKMDGVFSFDAKKITGESIRGIYSGNSFRLNGSVQRSENPKVEFSLTTESSQLSSGFTLQEKDLRPFTLTRRTPQSLFSVEGEVLNYEDPLLKLKGRWKGPVEELRQLKLFGEKPILTEALNGNFVTQFTLSGPKNRPDAMRVRGELVSPLLTYNTLSFRNVSSRYTYHENFLTLSHLSSRLFGGRLLGEAKIDLSDEKRYKIKMELAQARLRQTIHYFTSDQKGARGLLSGALQIEGKTNDAGSLIGDGWLKVEEGNLFQLAILARLTPVLRPLIASIYPGLGEMIVFEEAYAHFDVKERAITTENLMLKGDRATLYGEGAIGFDQSLDFRIWIQLTDPHLLERPTEISRLKNIFVNDVGMLSGEVRVTGTLKEPKYRYSPLPLNRLQHFLRETGNLLLKRLFE